MIIKALYPKKQNKHRLMVKDYLWTKVANKDTSAHDIRTALHLSEQALSDKDLFEIASECEFEVDMEGGHFG